jgi:cytochrome P450
MKRPPKLKGAPLIGNYRQFKKNPIDLLLTASEELGDLFMLKAMNKPIYFVNSPEFIEYVTKTNYTNYIKTPATPLRKILGDSIFTTDGEEWLQRRRMYQPALNNTAIRSYFSLIDNCIEGMMDRINDSLHKSDQVNITQLMTDVTVSILGKTLFSIDMELGSHVYDDIATIMEWIGDRRLRHPFVVPLAIKTHRNRKFLNAVASMDGFIYDIIHEKQKTSSGNEDLLSRFMQNEEFDGQKISSKSLRDEAMTIFLAGHETSANVLNWTFYLLAIHSEVQHKVYSEIKAMGEQSLSYEDIRKFPYLIQVLNESMRMYPPVWHFGRVAEKDDYIGEYFVPAGTAVRISPMTIQYNTRYWKNPEKFDPERFQDPTSIDPFVYIPFGAGPRLCAGRNFAMMEMIMIIVRVIRDYQLSYSGAPVEMLPLTTLRSKGDIMLQCEKRRG